MSRLYNVCIWCCGLGVAICCGAKALAAGSVFPTDLVGQWQVIQVAVDQQDQEHWMFSPDDPRLLGRLWEINATDIQRADGAFECKLAKLTGNKSETLQKFIGRNYRRPPAYEVPPHPTLTDFGLRVRNANVSPLQIHCRQFNSYWVGAWFALIDGNLLVGRGSGPEIQVLRKVTPKTPIQASFNCAKAESAVERTICGSRTLAAYDRSVAAAYRGRLRVADKPRTAVQEAQRQWLKARDACGADAACLEQSMRQRVDDLMQEW